MSDITVLGGRVEEGLEYSRKAFRLNPFPPGWYYLTLGQAQYAAREYAAAVETLRRDETRRAETSRKYGDRRGLSLLERVRSPR